MAVLNDTVTAGSVRVNGTSTQTWASHFTNANASNVKNIGTNNSVRQVTSNAAAGSSNGTIQLQLASGNILDLTGNKVLIVGAAPRPVDANGAATTAQVSNSYIDISDGSVLQLEGGGMISEWTAPMKGNATSKIMNNNGLIFWNSVQPGVALDGTQIVCAPTAGGGDAHFGYNPAAYVKNVKIEFLQTTNNQLIFAAQAIWGTDRVKAQDGIVITSTKGMTNISLFSWNQTAVPWLAGGNNFFMVYRDMGYNVGAGSQPSALKRSYRRAGWNTPGVTSYWYNQGQMSCAYVHVDAYTTLNASGVDTGVKTYIRKIDYINVGTVSTDNNAWDVVALRYSPTITDALGSPLDNAHIKVTCSSASVIAGTPYGTQKSPIAAIGYTGADGKFAITEPVTPNYNTNTTYYTDTFVGKTHAPSGKFHKFWEPNTKYIITNDSRTTVGYDIGPVYAANEFTVEIRSVGKKILSAALDVSGPIAGITALEDDTSYSTSATTNGITLTYNSTTGVTNLALAENTSYPLDNLYKTIIDWHFTTANLEAGTVVPVVQANGILDYADKLTITGPDTAVLVAGTKVKTLRTTQTAAFNTAGNPRIDVPYVDALGSRAKVTGLNPEGFSSTWYLRFKLSSSSTWSNVSGTSDSAVILVSQGVYDVQVRAPGYEWESALSIDTTTSLTLNAGLRYHRSANNTPQYLMSYNATQAAMFDFDNVIEKVSVTNTAGGIVSPGFAELYQATQRIQHLPSLVWTWVSPVTANATSQKIIIPTGNPTSMFLTADSNASVKITCPVIHESTGTSADDRVKGNADGYSIILGSPATAESAGLASQIISGLGGPSFDTSEHGLSIIEDLVQQVKTLNVAIKGRTDLIPDTPAAVGSEMTLTAAYDSAKTAAQLADIQASTLNANITKVNNIAVTGTGATGSEWGPAA